MLILMGLQDFNDKTILTVPENDFFDLYEGMKESDYETLLDVRNAEGEKYTIEEIPLTSKNVKGLDYKGSYLNFYLGNKVVLLPVYGDKNDGMIHCVTQQQPYEKGLEDE